MPPNKKLAKQSRQSSDDIVAVESSTSFSRSSVINPQDLRDIDILMKPFSGNENISVTQWFKDFENYCDLFKWNHLQKLVYARRLLRGPAKAFAEYEVKPLDYDILKFRLIKEFEEKVTSASVHKQLQARKKKKDESLQEYLYEMINIGFQARVEDAAIIEYVIAGIHDSEVNKVVLYGAEDMRDFKNKLKVYEHFKKNTGSQLSHGSDSQNQQVKSSNSGKDNKRNKGHCFNCGSTSHEFYDCPDKSKGPKCFRCHKFGHKGRECEQLAKKIDTVKVANLNDDRKTYCNVRIGETNLEGLVDTGSDITLIKETDFNKLKLNRNLFTPGFTVNGLGSEVRTKGCFISDLAIDNMSFPNTSIYVVADNIMRPGMLIGMNLLSQAKVVITQGGVKIEKVDNKAIEDSLSEEDSCVKRSSGNSAIDTFVVDSIEFPELDHIKNKNIAHELKEIIEGYAPKKVRESPIKMKITLLEDTPVYQPPRRLAIKERQFVETQVAEWIKDGIVRESFSNYASPIVLVKKKDNTQRLCVDYRNLNKKIYRDRFPIPIIDEQIDFLHDASFFSTLDLANGFFHVAIEEESIKYTAFVTPHGHYEFLRMPFGLCNSPPTFQRFIVAIFRPLIQARKVLIYIDDLIIPSKSEEEGFKVLEDVLKVATDFGLEIKWKKCKILQKEVEYLGYTISNGKIKPSGSKTKAVLNFPEPRTIQQVQSFLGLAGYFRKFIADFAIIARPLTALLKKGVKFRFSEECKESFAQLKRALATMPVLSIFRSGASTELHTDASAHGYGAVLLQIDPKDNKLHPISYMSRKTTPAEQKYSSYELEILAVIAAVKKYRAYLLGQSFKLVTDCKAFEMTLKKKDLATRVARWMLLLEEFDFIVEHRSGSRIKHADALSRNPVAMVISANDSVWKQLGHAQKEDESLQAIREILATTSYKDYAIHNDLLCKYSNGSFLYVVPRQMEDNLVRKIHEQGHFKYRKLEDIIRKEFFITQLREKVDTCVRNCVQCILANRKEGKAEGYLHPISKIEGPLDTFHLDHLGPLSTTSKNYKYILSIIDAFTKFVWIFPVKTLATDEVIKKLEIVATTFGNPGRIIADRGGAFIAKMFKEYCERQKIELIHITSGVPRGNGQIERTHRIVISVLTKLSIDDPECWYKHVNKVQQFLNSTYQRAICTSPFKLLTGTSMRLEKSLPIREIVEQEIIEIYQESRDDLREKAKEALLKIQEENRKTYNKNRKQAHKYQVEDLVAIERTQFGTGLKIRSRFLGPYKIVKVGPNERFEVTKVGEHEGPLRTTTSADKMKLWATYDIDESLSSEADEEEDGRV